MEFDIKSEYGAGAAGNAKTLTIAAVAKTKCIVSSFSVVVGVAATTNIVTVQLKAGSTVLWKKSIVASAAVGIEAAETFPKGLAGPVNTAVTLVVSAPGGTTVLDCNLAYELAT